MDNTSLWQKCLLPAVMFLKSAQISRFFQTYIGTALLITCKLYLWDRTFVPLMIHFIKKKNKHITKLTSSILFFSYFSSRTFEISTSLRLTGANSFSSKTLDNINTCNENKQPVKERVSRCCRKKHIQWKQATSKRTCK